MAEKIVIIATHGGEQPEKATLPFVVANAALAMDVQVTIILQGMGVMLAKKDCYDHIYAAGFDPVKKLVDSFFEFGGQMLVCIPCIEARHITQEMLLPKAQLVKAGKVVQEVLEAKSVLNY